jgi:hypothetical protein
VAWDVPPGAIGEAITLNVVAIGKAIALNIVAIGYDLVLDFSTGAPHVSASS